MFLKKLGSDGKIEKEEYEAFLKRYIDEDTMKLKVQSVSGDGRKGEASIEDIKELAQKIRFENYENKVYIRCLIEYSNRCKNACYYCGLTRENTCLSRYEMTVDEILDSAKNGYQKGYRTFVIQGGEFSIDDQVSVEKIANIVKELKRRYEDASVTLSLGEQSYVNLKSWKDAGADRYLLREETALASHYEMLHPKEMRLKNRMQCHLYLKELGYQVGAGFMVGAPLQSIKSLAEDLYYLDRLKPEMIGIGPFIPQEDTRFSGEERGDIDVTLFLLSVLRIRHPNCLLPATTALATADENGRKKGLDAGANVIMPNFTPNLYRKRYKIYDSKVKEGYEAPKSACELNNIMREWGYQVVIDKGNPVNLSEN